MSLHEVLTAAEADELYHLPKGSVKRDCNRRLFPEGSYRKSKSTWLITKEVLDERYNKKNA